jgi:hypothetical protein
VKVAPFYVRMDFFAEHSAVLRMKLATKPSGCGWKVTVYVSVARESCTFLCAYGLLAEHNTNGALMRHQSTEFRLIE